MRQSSSIARLTTILLLGSAVVSALAASRLHRDLVVAQAGERAAVASVATAAADADLLASKMQGAYRARPLVDELTQLIARTRTEGIKRGVDVTSIGTERGVAMEEQAITLIAEPVNGVAGMSRVRVVVKGGYKNYLGLKDWLTDLVALPISISGIKVHDMAFELQLDVFGTM